MLRGHAVLFDDGQVGLGMWWMVVYRQHTHNQRQHSLDQVRHLHGCYVFDLDGSHLLAQLVEQDQDGKEQQEQGQESPHSSASVWCSSGEV